MVETNNAEFDSPILVRVVYDVVFPDTRPNSLLRTVVNKEMGKNGAFEQIALDVEGKRDGTYTRHLRIKFPETSFSLTDTKSGAANGYKRPCLKSGMYRLYCQSDTLVLQPYSPPEETIINYCFYSFIGSLVAGPKTIDERNTIYKTPMNGYEGEKEFVFSLVIVDIKNTSRDNNRIHLLVDDRVRKRTVRRDGIVIRHKK